MAYLFKKHYTRDQARSLLPNLRRWLGQLADLREKVDRQEERLRGLMAQGSDLGGSMVNAWARTLVEVNAILAEFYRREIQIKDLDRGLVDFPALIGGKEVFLCWEKDEDDIEFWHELDSGFAGREPL